MSQRVLNLNEAQIISGTEMMTGSENSEHTHLVCVSVPCFATRPDITVSIYSAEGIANPEIIFPPSVEYIPKGAANGQDLIAIATVNTHEGTSISLEGVNVVCSYLAVGEKL